MADEAYAPSEVAVEWARYFAAGLSRAETERLIVLPTHAGGVAIEVHDGERRWLLDIDPDGAADLVTVDEKLGSTLSAAGTPVTAVRSLRDFAR